MNTFIRQTDAIYTVSFADGTTLETTWNHPFRVKKQGHTLEKFSIENTTWVQAKDLNPGDVALGADGKELFITDIIIDEREETVYNFEVEEYHTYFVGEVGVWVHNADYKFSSGKACRGNGGTSNCDYMEMKIDKNGVEKFVTFERLGKAELSALEMYKGSDGSMIIEDQNGNLVHHYQENGQNLAQTLGKDMESKGKFYIEGKEVTDGSIVGIGRDGKLKIVKDIEANATVFQNGQLNSGSDATDSLRLTHSVNNGRPTYLVYNATEGGWNDTQNSIKLRNGNVNVEKSEATLTKLLQSGKVSNLVCHSQGGAICGNAITAAQQNSKVNLSNLRWTTVGGAQHSNNVPTGLTANRVNFFTNVDDSLIHIINRSGNVGGRQNGYNVENFSGIGGHPYYEYIENVSAVLRNQ